MNQLIQQHCVTVCCIIWSVGQLISSASWFWDTLKVFVWFVFWLQVAEWGQMTMCDAERRLLANALLDISNEWFVLVSESCIPIFDFNTTYRYFRNSNQSFLMAFDDPGPYGRGRYNWNMTPEVELDQWRKGSQWFEVHRELAIEIVKDTVYYPKFKEFCRPHCYVDEHYFPTMLTIEAPNRLANRSVTWVDWSRGGAHPATFGRRDITLEFLRRVREGRTCLHNNQNSTMCFLFARKFAPSTLEPLLELAPTVLGFGWWLCQSEEVPSVILILDHCRITRLETWAQIDGWKRTVSPLSLFIIHKSVLFLYSNDVFRRICTYLSSHGLEWFGVEFSLESALNYFNLHGLKRLHAHPNEP